jgi:vancomycin resistance protein YoaR
MTTMTDPLDLPGATERRRPSARFRFAVAFLASLIAALALGAGALFAYDQQYAGRVLPGVSVGRVDLSGLAPGVAATELERAFASFGEGEIVLRSTAGELAIAFAEVGRRADVETMLAAALAVGRSGNLVENAISDARTAMRGVKLEPRVTFDPDAVVARVDALAATLDRDPVSASVAIADGGFILSAGSDGRFADRATPTTAILAALGEIDAPSRIVVDLPLLDIEPAITTAEATAARDLADRVTSPVTLAVGKDAWTIPAETLREWTRFLPTVDGGYIPLLDTTGLAGVVKALAKEIDRPAVSASFKVKGGKITGITESKSGRKLDVASTTAQVEALLASRRAAASDGPVVPALAETQPALTTEQAAAAAPRMKRLSHWTTYFPISEKNGFGANIWIPALDIDGYVVGPGQTFDFWDAIGPVTRARGYRDGGAIINGRTEPQGALAGGICSCSTTLFNAALRAGLKMGARRNHYYYIDRYPIGLDATVFKSGSGSVQTMTFTNDTAFPIFVRGFRIRNGGAGYVRFEIHGVPTGRKVTFSKPIIRNIRPAADRIQLTSSLKPGVRQRVEYPADGKQVWVTRTVRDADGKILHQETYYSNYARVDGITLVGKGAPAPEPSPTP